MLAQYGRPLNGNFLDSQRKHNNSFYFSDFSIFLSSSTKPFNVHFDEYCFTKYMEIDNLNKKKSQILLNQFVSCLFLWKQLMC